MARIVYDSKGNKLGSYDGNDYSGTIYDKDGNYAGKYSGGHNLYNKEGSSRGTYNNPEHAVRILLEK